MLKDVSIKRFKCIEDAVISFEKINILVGANNSGKTSVLQAIHFAVALAQSVKLITGNSALNVATLAPHQILYTPLNDVIALAYGGKLIQARKSAIEIHFALTTGETGYIRVRRGKNRNLALELEGEDLLKKLEDITKPFSIYVPGLSGLAKTEPFIAGGQLLRAVARGDANLVLRNVLKKLHEKSGRWKEFTDSLKMVFPGLGIKIEFDSETDEFINAFIGQGASFHPVDSAGTGMLQAIQILSYIYLFRPSVLLLDEPDSHLHPNNQRLLVRVLQSVARKEGTQILMATHSRHILDSLDQSIPRIWISGGSVAQAARSDHLKVLMDLGALDSAENLLSGTFKYVFLTEDSRKDFLNTLLLTILKEDQFQIWSYDGCTRTDVASALGKFIKSVSPSTEVIVHRDSDYIDEEYRKMIKDNYSRYDLKVYFTPGVDIETIFCRLKHLKQINPEHKDTIENIWNEEVNNSQSEFKVKAKKGRSEVEDRKHKEGLGSISKTEQQDWLDSLDFKEERWIRGKDLLSKIRRRFQSETGRNLKVKMKSKYLNDQELIDLLQRDS